MMKRIKVFIPQTSVFQIRHLVSEQLMYIQCIVICSVVKSACSCSASADVPLRFARWIVFRCLILGYTHPHTRTGHAWSMCVEHCSRDSRFTQHAMYIAAPIYTVCIRVLQQLQFARVSANVTLSRARARIHVAATLSICLSLSFFPSFSLCLSFARSTRCAVDN